MSTVTTLGVTGMTCGNCVAHVTKDLEAVAGVENVSVELRVGSTSEVTVFSDDPLDEGPLRAAGGEGGSEVAAGGGRGGAVAAQYAEQAADKQEAHDCTCGCGTEPAADAAPATKTYDLQVPPRA